MANQLKKYFPVLWEREDLLAEIHGNRKLLSRYEQLDEKEKEEFIGFCMGMLGTKILRDAFFKEVTEKSEYIKEQLEKINGVKSVSGMGLMIGVEVEKSAADIANECLKKGLLVLTAKTKVRLLPALNITREEIDKGLSILKEVIEA